MKSEIEGVDLMPEGPVPPVLTPADGVWPDIEGDAVYGASPGAPAGRS